jgi:hypothetical protein
MNLNGASKGWFTKGWFKIFIDASFVTADWFGSNMNDYFRGERRRPA